MEKESFVVVSGDQSESSSSSSFIECLLPTCREKTPETSSTTINDSLGCDQKVLSADYSLCPDVIDKKLNSLLAQTTQLTEKFESRNASLRKTLTEINGKQEEVLKESKTAEKEKEHTEATCLSGDDESDYSIIPLENNHQRKADETTAFQDTLLELHELKGRHTKVAQELVEEQLRTNNLTKLLEEKDEQNRILKEFFNTSKQQVLKNVQLQSELDSVRKELADVKQEAEQLQKRYEEKEGEVETYKEELLNLQTSHTNIDCSLQAEIEALHEALRSARHQQDYDRMNLTEVTQKLEKLSEDNHEMAELLSTLKIENDELKMERTVKKCEYQERLDCLTAKLVDTEQRLDHIRDKLSSSVRSQPESSSPFSSLTDNPPPDEVVPSEQWGKAKKFIKTLGNHGLAKIGRTISKDQHSQRVAMMKGVWRSLLPHTAKTKSADDNVETSVKSQYDFRCPHCCQPVAGLAKFEEHLQVCDAMFV